MMKRFFKALSCVSVGLVLVSCGGGGDVAGDEGEFLISPKEYKVSMAPDSNGGCSGAAKVKPVVFTIIGGQSPFRIVNSDPQAIIVDKTEASGKDPKFTVSFQKTSYCAAPAVITVLDYHSRVATIEITTEVAEDDGA